MITEVRSLEATGYRRGENGPWLSSAYESKGHWYACDADGLDLPGSWRMTRADAENFAKRYAERLALS